ncbi:MAG: DUF4148 domain-containing protein [Rhizobacter sp.]|nr:DUF4148 domain-containing protein [Rhizobacter sp.]
MNKINALLLTSLSLFAATTAFAGESASTRTRADVIAELVAARAAGELPVSGYETSYTVNTRSAASTLTRADVQAEYARARQAGELEEVTGYSSVANVATGPSRLTRSDVVNEYVRARSTGELAEASNDFGLLQFRRVMR